MGKTFRNLPTASRGAYLSQTHFELQTKSKNTLKQMNKPINRQKTTSFEFQSKKNEALNSSEDPINLKKYKHRFQVSDGKLKEFKSIQRHGTTLKSQRKESRRLKQFTWYSKYSKKDTNFLIPPIIVFN